MTDRQASKQIGKRSKLTIWILVSTIVLMMTVLCKGINVQAETGTPIDGTITCGKLQEGDYIGSNTTITGCNSSCIVFINVSGRRN